jgi:hypothetical protein
VTSRDDELHKDIPFIRGGLKTLGSGSVPFRYFSTSVIQAKHTAKRDYWCICYRLRLIVAVFGMGWSVSRALDGSACIVLGISKKIALTWWYARLV